MDAAAEHEAVSPPGMANAGSSGNEAVRRLQRSCPCCGSQERKPLPWGQEGWATAQCTGCNLAYTTEAPDFEALATTFEWSATYATEAERRRKRSPLAAKFDGLTRWRTRIITQTNPMDFVRPRLPKGVILDIGCGNGSYLATHAKGYTLYGVDISPPLIADAARICEPTGGSAICAPAVEGLQRIPEGSVDAAILRSYLEHESEPLAVLIRLRSVLKVSGFAVVKVPNYNSLNRFIMRGRWCGFRFPDHLNYFTPETLADLARRAGYRTVWRWRDRLPTDDNMWCVLEPELQPVG